MRTLPRALVLALLVVLCNLAGGVLGQPSCAGLTVKASTRSKVTRGKTFGLTVRINDQEKRRRKQAFDSSTVLQIVLPQGVYFQSAAKPLAQPAFWGYRDSILLWQLSGVQKQKLRVTLGVACSCTAPLLSFGVSVARLDGQGNTACQVNATAQAKLKVGRSKQRALTASSWASTCVGPATGSCANACDTCIPVSWSVVASTGQDIGGVSWGTLRTPDGIGYIYSIVPLNNTIAPPAPEVPPLNPPYNGTDRATRDVSLRKPDIPTLQHFASSGRTFIINNMEDYPATMYVTEVSVNPTTGLLTMLSARAMPAPAPDSPWWFLCAGSLTPWGTKLAGEEFPPDARIPWDQRFDSPPNTELDALFAMREVRAFGYYNNRGRPGDPPLWAGAALPVPFPSKGDISTNATLKLEAAASIKPYNYGATAEVAIDANGQNTIVRKLWTMGRLSHELSVVLPDERTVLTTDDVNGNGIVAMFIADQAGDLTSGRLYAAKFANQKPPLDPVTGAGAEWDVQWIELGHATQAELEAMRPTLNFTDIFDTATPTVAGTTLTCPGGFARVNSINWRVQPGNFRAECLRLRAGMEKAAAFFETQRYAGLMGATVEFTKAEGLAYSAELGTVYVATARLNNGMTDGAIPINGYPYVYDISAARDDIRLPENLCGGVIEMDVNLASGSWVPVRARMAITGAPILGDPQNTCNTERIAGPDNLFVIPGTSTLLIAEDPGSGQHRNPYLWAVDILANRPPLAGSPWPVFPQMTRIMTGPVGSEITGQNTGEAQGWLYIMAAVQNPGDDSNIPAPMGYIGPIPASAIPAARAKRPSGPPASNTLARLNFGAVPVPTGADQTRIVATNQVCVW